MLWVKSLHIISVIAWMAGLLYLPRLFVNHAQVPVGSERSEMLKGMEYRLSRYIMTPASIASWVFGLWLVFGYQMASIDDYWMWVKFIFVILLTSYHHVLLVYLKKFKEDRNDKSDKYYRIINEAPTLFMVIIVIMVVVKPF